MAMGSYNLGATVRVPLQITDTGIAFTEDVDPTIYKIVKPDGESVSGFPADMSVMDQDYATYYYDYVPDTVGDYVVIMAYYVEGVEFTIIENFTVKSAGRAAPRAESR